ncbi:MAG: protein translocase subunit SecD [Patescibacteria group bacterium]
MSNRRTYITLAVVFFLAIFAGFLVYPAAWNKGADYINAEFGVGAPHFFNVPFKLGLDLQGGMHLVYEADLSGIAKQDKGPVMDGLRDVIERRVNFFGVSEPIIQVQKERLVVELAGIIDPAEAIKQIGKTPFLEFKEQKANFDEIIKENKEDPFQSTLLTGRYLKKAEVSLDQQIYKPLVLLEFNDEGAKLFEGLTEKNVGKQLAIYVDGIPLSSPVVNEKISGGKAQISGSFSIDEAKKLAQNLNAGALPVPIKLISQQTVGPTLGKVSLEKSLSAGIFGFLAVIAFMIIFYRLPGVLASLALAIYVVLILAIFKLMSVTLTLSGIAGFILSIGMAVDANVLIFSRMREELKLDKSFLISVGEGFRRAWPSIRDSNLNTLIVSSIFFTFGTSFVKGFAFTLILGVLISMFSAVFVTRNLLKLFQDSKINKYKILW